MTLWTRIVAIAAPKRIKLENEWFINELYKRGIKERDELISLAEKAMELARKCDRLRDEPGALARQISVQRRAELRKEGVTDQDIEWYCGLSRFTVGAMEVLDDLDRFPIFAKALADSGDPVKASQFLRAKEPLFGDWNTEHPATQGEDRPLPPHLIRRVSAYLSLNDNHESIAREALANQQSFNSILRAHIRSGLL